MKDLIQEIEKNFIKLLYNKCYFIFRYNIKINEQIVMLEKD